MDFDTGSGYDDGDDYNDGGSNPEDFDHDTSYHGEGFDTPQKEFDPKPAKFTIGTVDEDNDEIGELERSNKEVYEFAMKALRYFARNRHIRLLKKTGQSSGYEKCFEQLIEDYDAGYFQLTNKMIDGLNTCVLLEFNVFNGSYAMGVDNYRNDDYPLDKLGIN